MITNEVDPTVKTCTRCGASKPIAAFAFRRRATGRLQSWCRACHAEVDRLRYLKMFPDARLRRRQAGRMRDAEIRRRLDQILAESGCVDCGIKDPVVLEFDHVGPKTADVSRLAMQAPWSLVLEEIARCEVRCVNCHKRITAARRKKVA
jgi:hypothetical protein